MFSGTQTPWQSKSKVKKHFGLCPHRPKLKYKVMVCEDTDHGLD